eukprot:CAMPEP_0176374494 /NCGR_PEP_ID=MMETSP0126-20121128/26794_1 /TAXON_ID=141414 ORGANISM="Strombidinopsis acuminatum, Strain SPMC142" /NCGR_SAMPLE_ID=MMETSP0126 /ASSEMBLY_ACC=CAM_ASM_000229 /LENGTH=102 /DNA_ID=CAMNT_0017735087 /DNA_START=14 /DNA_END=319 /DNA_ORIENTATION=-
MASLARNKLQASSEDYFEALFQQYGCIPPNHQMAIDMRMKFFTKYILERSAAEYTTGVEKDWAYVARAEYRHDVNTMATLDGMAAGLTACMVRMYMLKKFVW